jgi:lipid II:glycine glycyltransferase (peptidoglycan interpeptide bridge formation enzyme)
VLIDLSGDEAALLGGMKPKWRYNAKLALKRGVLVRRAGEERLGQFYALLKETALRDGIAVHGIEYYRTLFTHSRTWASSPAPDIRLYLAEHEGDVLGGIITLFRGKEAVYLYGASSDKKRNLMAPYALQLKAMEDARLAGCAEYDLFGIPPSEDPDHPMAGLYRFKTGFGGRIVHRIGSWDLAYRPLAYRLFRAAETLRKNLRKLKKKRAFSRRGKPGDQ